MYIEKEGNDFLVINESGHVVATRKNERDAHRFIKGQKNSRSKNNNRRQERVTFSSRDED